MIRPRFYVLPAVLVLAMSVAALAGEDKKEGRRVTRAVARHQDDLRVRSTRPRSERSRCTEYKNEERTREVTGYKQVPVTEEKECKYTVMVPEEKTRTEKYTVCKPVWETKTCEYTVCVPYTEEVEQKYTRLRAVHRRRSSTSTPCAKLFGKPSKRSTRFACLTPKGRAEVHRLQAGLGNEREKYTVCVPYTEEVKSTRKVCKCVPHTKKRTIKVCCGHWENETKEVCDRCNPCCKKTVCCREWVPEEKTRKSSAPPTRCVTEEVPCTRTVCKTREEERTCSSRSARWFRKRRPAKLRFASTRTKSGPASTRSARWFRKKRPAK